MVNAAVGTTGHGSERGLASLGRFLRDNEVPPTALFRGDSHRVIVFVADEDDQSLRIPASPPPGFDPFTGYRCDRESLARLNGTRAIATICCQDPAKPCRLGATGTSCPAKQIGGEETRISVCPDPERLVPVAEIRDEIHDFFRRLDGRAEIASSLLFATITPLRAETVRELQEARGREDRAVGALRTVAVDRGDRYLELGRISAPRPIELDIGEPDYAPLLDSIGVAVTLRKGEFELERLPTDEEDMIVTIARSDGARAEIPRGAYEVRGKKLQISDLDVILAFRPDDRIEINYQPATAF